MDDHISDINLDGLLGVRFVEELFRVWLGNYQGHICEVRNPYCTEVKKLHKKARVIADRGIPYIQENEPEYFASIGVVLQANENLPWYPSRSTDPKFLEQRGPCKDSAFNESFSDVCLKEIYLPEKDHCKISNECTAYMTKHHQTGYILTHQVLYHQLVQKIHNSKSKCLSRLNYMNSDFEVSLCTNVLRDANETASSGYPLSHRDLFMEQIGLCGYWGFRDFYKQEWLTEILSWQHSSGCYKNASKWKCTDHVGPYRSIVKREEKLMEDGCLSHKTTLALLAIAASIRYNVEKISA
ncbi:UPF0764 protein C16orf89 homolog [Uloborus diversus]|uniref:UPF0764 protein C16orf89 homolog n=1 Tax=Uloborus diversus TaxID=327109 RepID=UPI00240A6C39|nr:UPF0764 protein C16orf89 homolog [Uloborus diversus]